MLKDAQGRYWMRGGESGKWLAQNGAAWVEANAYGADQANAKPLPPTDLPERGASGWTRTRYDRSRQFS